MENAVAADPLIDLAETDYYALGRGEPERVALLEGYGPVPDDATERLDLYRLYHAVELWDWFRSIGTTEPLGSVAGDIARPAAYIGTTEPLESVAGDIARPAAYKCLDR